MLCLFAPRKALRYLDANTRRRLARPSARASKRPPPSPALLAMEKARKRFRPTAATPACASFLHTFEVAAASGEHMADRELCRLGAAGKTSFVYILDLRFEDRTWSAVFCERRRRP